MKKIFIAILLLLPAVLIAAEPDKTICAPFYQILEKLEHQEISVNPAQFEFYGKAYDGCEIVFKTKWSMMKEGFDPMNSTYPKVGSDLYNAGWRVDERFSADDPGATFYVLRNGEKVCNFLWSYEVYIDEKKEELITGDDILCNVRCGTNGSD